MMCGRRALYPATVRYGSLRSIPAMLMIRDSQLQSFGDALTRIRADVLLPKVRAALPEQTKDIPEPILREKLRALVVQAEAVELFQQKQQLPFAMIGIWFGEAFPTPWMKDILEDENSLGDGKLSAICDELSEGGEHPALMAALMGI